MMYCPCGYHRMDQDAILEHQKNCARARLPGHGTHVGHIYQVDGLSHGKWAKEMGWENPPFFPNCHPVQRGGYLLPLVLK